MTAGVWVAAAGLALGFVAQLAVWAYVWGSQARKVEMLLPRIDRLDQKVDGLASDVATIKGRLGPWGPIEGGDGDG